MSKLIYLDLNVFTYMQYPRDFCVEKDKSFYTLIQKLKGKYDIPYSQIHIFDLLKSSKEDLLKKDLLFMGQISNNRIIGEHKETNELILDEFPPEQCYKDTKRIMENDPKNLSIEFPPFSFSVDMNKLEADSFYSEFLSANNGEMNSEKLAEFLENQFEEFMDRPQMYKKLRENSQTILNSIDISKLNAIELKHFTNLRPMLECWMDLDVNNLEKNFIQAVRQYIKASNKEFDELSKKEQIQCSYHLLALHPIFRDTIKNKTKNMVSNMVNDSSHLYFASTAKYFVSEDNTLVKKVNLFIRYLQ